MFLNIKCFFLAFFFFIFSFSSFANFCEGTFGTRLYFEELARRQGIKDKEFHSQFVDPIAERKLVHSWNEQPMWNEKPLPPLLRALLPPDTHFIGRQLYRPGTPSSVKMHEPGEALIVRAYYNYNKRNPRSGKSKTYRLGTNVTFSARAFRDNMENPREDNWLVGRNAKAAVLYLHGGGTSTTGAHSAANLISHLSGHKIDVVSLDLGWHGQGHRKFFSFKSEVEALSAFAKKYIPPNVPLFVWGHSWGGVFADQLMTMTDRPSFSFHRNLAGVIIMSTALDSAPGKMTAAEKFEAFLERLHRAKETSEAIGNEKERSIYRNIIEDGKISPLGNLVSSGSILQSEHSIPPHQGTLYVPGMMLVGIHDTLVYHAWKDLFHQRYDNLKNITPSNRHYIDKGFVEMDDGTFAEKPMGHLPAGFRVEGNKESPFIQHSTTLAFMEQQLRLRPIRQAILKAAGLGKTPYNGEGNENTDYQNRKKRIEYLPSFEAAREYVTTEMQNVPPETVRNIIRQIDNAESSGKPLLPKLNKPSRIPFVDVVKNAANDLGFRGFLLNYHHVSQNRNQRHNAIEKNLPVSNSIKMLLNPFSSTLKRAFHLVQEFAKKESSYDYVILMKELELVIRLSEKIKSSLSAQLLEELRVLKAMVEKLPNNRESIHQEAENILERNQKVFKSVNIDELPKKIKDTIMDFTLARENNLDAVREKLEEGDIRIPEPVKEEALRLKQELIISSVIAEDRYIPSIKELAPLLENRSNRTRDRVQNVLEEIAEEATKRLNLLKDRVVFKDGLAEKKEERDELMKKVGQGIKAVKRGLEKEKVNPPTALAEAEKKSAEDLERLIEAQDRMEDELNRYAAEIFLGEELRPTREIIDGYNKGYKKYAENFTNLYQEYVQKRRSLDKEVLMAMKTGEMGEEFQKAVNDLYGVKFDGTIVRKSAYLELIKAMHYIAMVETALKDNTQKVIKATKDYDSKMQRLLNLLTTRRSTGADPSVIFEGELRTDLEVVPNIPQNHHVLNRIRSAMDLYTYVDIQMADVLNGAKEALVKEGDNQEHRMNLVGNKLIIHNGNIRRLNGGVPGRRKGTKPAKGELIKYIKHHGSIFEQALKEYKDSEATLPSEVPLISLEDVLVNE